MDEEVIGKLGKSTDVQNKMVICATHALKCPKCAKLLDNISGIAIQVYNHALSEGGI